MTGIESDTSQLDISYKPYFGANEGWSKLELAYRAGSLVMWSENGEVSEEQIEKISSLARKVDALGERSASLSNKFQKYSEKGVSLTVENSAIFGAAAAGAFIGPTGAIAGSAAATYPQTLGSWFLKRLDDAGYDAKDPEQLKAAVNDPEFMTAARRSSHIHAAQMSGAVMGAGMLAGYVYSAFAKSVTGIGASIGRSVFPRLMGEFAEKGATMFGDVLAKGFKSGVNSMGRKALASRPIKPVVRGAFLVAGLAVTSIGAQAEYQDVRSEHRAPGFPSYNTSLRYL